jgi:hypothetical protein
MDDFRQEVARRVSIDGNKVSLNALELLTRENGIERAILDIVSDCLLRQKAKKSVMLNDTIMQELMDVQKMLEVKNK